MSVYATSDLLYSCVQELFNQVQRTHPGAAEAIARSGMNYRLRTATPAGTILIAGRDRPPALRVGSGPARVDIDIELNADTLHEILLGELSVTKALGQRRLKVKGPVIKAMSLADLFRHGRTIYPGVLQAHGL